MHNNSIIDLHIHSKHSRACSTDLDLKNLEKYARIKGVDLLGTGDFTHPKWIEEIKTSLSENTTGNGGVLESKTGFKFILSTEISLIYTHANKGRKVHNVVLAPSIEVAEQITEQLKKHGRVDYDGRPIFGMSCIQFVEELREISKDIEIIPAHAWTPWFSLFGSNSGFDSIKECFGEYTKHIHAIETGLSSNPPMNWRLSQLDNFQIVSFSDAHSFWPWRLGREATLIDGMPETISYEKILKAIRTGDGLAGTIEVDPNYGKYHFDGHRACNVCMKPAETRKNKGICPKCKRQMTIGVQYRVEELADRPEGFIRKNAPPFHSLMPLSEILAAVIGKGLATKTVFAEFYKLQKAFSTEYNIIFNASREELEKHTHQKIVDAIIKNREGAVSVTPGYDGVYGIPQLEKAEGMGETKEKKEKKEAPKKEKKERKKKHMPQRSLSEF
ncbi:MAG: endonuclease Q family protein [Candidatus Woesearchaeota archaeon]|nr:endonuclease Q family protein [Candidatus Woesearchaeota archaeon]